MYSYSYNRLLILFMILMRNFSNNNFRKKRIKKLIIHQEWLPYPRGLVPLYGLDDPVDPEDLVSRVGRADRVR